MTWDFPDWRTIIVLYSAAAFAIFAAGGIFWSFARFWRERDTDYLRQRVRELRDMPEQIEERRRYVRLPRGWLEDQAAARYAVKVANPNYKNSRKELERLESKLHRSQQNSSHQE